MIFGDLCVSFEPRLVWEFAYVCHDLRTEEKAFKTKRKTMLCE